MIDGVYEVRSRQQAGKNASILKNSMEFQNHSDNPEKIYQVKQNFLFLQKILQICKLVELVLIFRSDLWGLRYHSCCRGAVGILCREADILSCKACSMILSHTELTRPYTGVLCVEVYPLETDDNSQLLWKFDMVYGKIFTTLQLFILEKGRLRDIHVSLQCVEPLP